MTGNDQTATGKRSPWIWFSAIGLILVSLLICEIKSFHIVRPEKIGVRMRLGQPVDIVEPGLHYFQWPLETVETVNFGVDRIAIDLTMLPSSDRHLMDASFFVMWSIVDPISYVASKRDAVAEIRDNFERELRDELSRRPANDLYRESGRKFRRY